MPRNSDFAIIGMGPRGLSVLERICSNIGEIRPTDRINVHIIEATGSTPSAVWRTNQSRHLLMNTVAAQISLFTDSSVECEGPVVTGPSLHEWARFLVLMDPTESYEPWVLAEAYRLEADAYPSRAFYGEYLAWVLRRLIKTAPASLRVEVHHARATRLRDAPDGRQEIHLEGALLPLLVDGVVLAQGHVPMELTADERRMRDLADRHALRYIPPRNPADVDLEAIAPGESVILRGLGLNFFDYMALFTSGRGGRFSRVAGKLQYHPSGCEPRLFAGSRRGVPYHARGENEKGAYGRHQPLYLTQAVIDGFRIRAARGERADFAREIWPLVADEVETVYYTTLISSRTCACTATAFMERYRTVRSGSPAEAALLAEFEIAPEDRWDWQRLAYPQGGRSFGNGREYRRWLLTYLRKDMSEALQGNISGPLKAALDVLRDLRNELRMIIDHAGITGDSFHRDLQNWFTPLNAFLSIGPPASRIEELIALIESGIVEVLGPQVSVEVLDGRFHATSPRIPGQVASATTLIEARLPEADIRRTTDQLLLSLLEEGTATPYAIPNPDGSSYETGGLAVTGKPYRLVDHSGAPHPRRFAFGVPTEGVHWVTAVGIRPGVNSVTLVDADAIARALLLLRKETVADTRERHVEPAC